MKRLTPRHLLLPDDTWGNTFQPIIYVNMVPYEIKGNRDRKPESETRRQAQKRAHQEKVGNIMFPDQIGSKESLDETLDTIIFVYRQLVKHGCIVAGVEADERRLVASLHNKIEHGTHWVSLAWSGEIWHGLPRPGTV